jgi:hypothetical protein
MDWGCVWYGAIVFKISPYYTHPQSMNAVIPCNTYHNISYFKYDSTYHMHPQSMNTVIPCNTYHILNTMAPHHTHPQSMNTVIPCNISYLRCVWYGAMVFKIWYVVMCITWYHRIHGLRMRMIRCHLIKIWYGVIRITWHHRIKRYVVIRISLC